MARRNTVSFISAKGGSGKTVTCVSVGRVLAKLGYKVLLVDTDASTNGLTLFFLPYVNKHQNMQSNLARGVFDAEGQVEPVASQIEQGLDLIPATYRLSQTEGTDAETFRRSLQMVISSSTSKYDFVLLDAQAGSDIYAQIAASLADTVVIVTEFDPISFQGVDRLKILFAQVMDPARTWILYNKILPEFATAIGEGLIVAQVLPPIPIVSRRVV